MPRTPKPWYWDERQAWYVTIRGVRHNLGPDQKQARRQFHELMSAPEPQPVRSDSLIALIDQFLDWVENNRSPATFEWYRSRLQLFATRYPELRARDLKPFHVQQWIDSFKISQGGRRNYARAIVSCLNWCEEQGHIERSPLVRFKKPRGGKRDKVVSAEEYALVLENIRSPEFRDLVCFVWETGARAAEVLAIEHRHVDLQNARIVFPIDEEKMERAPRILYLNTTATAIIERLLARTTRHVFLNTHGVPWTTEAVNCAFQALQIRMGMQAMREKGIVVSDAEIKKRMTTLRPEQRVGKKTVRKSDRDLYVEARRKLTKRLACKHAPKLCLTNFRHTWCHNALRSGLDALTVSMLMGHADPSMVARVYSHLNHAPEFLRTAAEQAGAVKKTPALP